jgi:hypothetical protein
MDGTFGLTAVPGTVTAESLPITGKEVNTLSIFFSHRHFSCPLNPTFFTGKGAPTSFR